MLPSKFKSTDSPLLLSGPVELCLLIVSGTQNAHIPFFGFYKSYDDNVPCLSKCQSPPHCHSCSSPSLAKNRSLSFCHVTVIRARLEWIRCCTSDRLGFQTDCWMVQPSFCGPWKIGPDGQVTGAPSWVGLTELPSCCFPTELFTLWEYYVVLKVFLQLWFICHLFLNRI